MVLERVTTTVKAHSQSFFRGLIYLAEGVMFLPRNAGGRRIKLPEHLSGNFALWHRHDRHQIAYSGLNPSARKKRMLSKYRLLNISLEESSVASILSVVITFTTSLLVLAYLSFGTSGPTVWLDRASVTGLDDGTVSKFLGIPYAFPPIEQLRFRRPQDFGPYEKSIQATAYGPACPQPKPLVLAVPGSELTSFQETIPTEESEDCLSINIIRPSFATIGSKLPVIVWIYGGGFETGSTELYDHQVVRIVQRSVALDKPVILASVNYRVSAFGFLGGKEVYKERVGNLGLWDQRSALRWVNKYIEEFGGDKSKVTLWGESAGAISIAMQMLAFGGDTQGYFHAGFMQSGATLSVGSILKGQAQYDSLVNEAGCRDSSDTLNCLREVEFSVLKNAVDKTSSSHSNESSIPAYIPRVDGYLIPDEPYKLVKEGRVATIPIVSGNCDDEGTTFAFSSLDIISESQFRQHISQVWLPEASAEELEPLWSLYTSNPADGSPFDTGDANLLTPQFKRMAALRGDMTFQAPRRFFLKSLSGRQKLWSFLTKQAKQTPFIGSFHGSDLILQLTDDYVINFANNHDPNTGGGPIWPEYTAESPKLYTFPPDFGLPVVTLDDYRAEQFEILTNLSYKYPT